MKKKRFKVGDKVTYKDGNHCTNGAYYYGAYYYGGSNQCGYVAMIIKYLQYNEEKQCWKIEVTVKHGNHTYKMLECEFEEYDMVKDNNLDLFPIY